MFNYYSLSPHLECYIDCDKLIVELPFGGDPMQIRLTPSKFIQDRKLIKDERKSLALNPSSLFAIGTVDGYTIVGTSHYAYMILNPQGVMIERGWWDSGSTTPRIQAVGIHANAKHYRAAYINSRIPNVIQVFGTNSYAHIEEDFYRELWNYEYDMDTAIPTFTGSYAEDVYFLEYARPDEHIIKKYKDDSKHDVLGDIEIRGYDGFWRYAKDSEIFPVMLNYNGKLGPYSLPFIYNVDLGKKYRQFIPRDYVLQALENDDDAIGAYVVNEQTLNLLYTDHVTSKVLRMHDLEKYSVYKTTDVPIDEIELPSMFPVGYKATKPLCLGVVPHLIVLYAGFTGQLLGEDFKVEHASVSLPPPELYRDMVDKGYTYSYIESKTQQPIFLVKETEIC